MSLLKGPTFFTKPPLLDLGTSKVALRSSWRSGWRPTRAEGRRLIFITITITITITIMITINIMINITTITTCDYLLLLRGRRPDPSYRIVYDLMSMYMYMYVYIYIYIYICLLYAYTRICMCMYMYVYIHIHICERVRIYIYIYVHVPTRAAGRQALRDKNVIQRDLYGPPI